MSRAMQPTRPAAPSPKRDFLAMLDEARPEIEKLLPPAVSAERVIRIVRTEFLRNDKIRKCTAESILFAVLKACELNLEVGGGLKHGYFIPYGTTCEFQPSYLGLLELARRSGAFRSIEARLVHESDVFQVAYTPEPEIDHRPFLDGDAGKPTHVYAFARLINGALACEVMTWAEVEKVRALSRQSEAWAKWPGEMAKKAVLKRFLKRQPCSIEMATAIELDNREYRATEAPPHPRPISRTAALAAKLGCEPGPLPEPEFQEGTAGEIATEDAPEDDGLGQDG